MITARQAIEDLSKMYDGALDQPIIITWWDFDFAEFFMQDDNLTIEQRKEIWAKVSSSERIMDEISDFQYETLAEAINKEII